MQVLQAARLVLRNFKRQHRIGDRDISTFKMRGRINIKKRLLENRGTERWEESWGQKGVQRGHRGTHSFLVIAGMRGIEVTSIGYKMIWYKDACSIRTGL